MLVVPEKRYVDMLELVKDVIWTISVTSKVIATKT